MNNFTEAFIEAKTLPTNETIETLLHSLISLLEDFENNQININNVINELRENGIDIPESLDDELIELDMSGFSEDEIRYFNDRNKEGE